MKKLATTALLLAGALALAGCTGEGSGTTETDSAAPVAAQQVVDAEPTPTPTPTKTADPSQAWADKMINLLLNGNSKSSFSEFSPEIAHHYIESWSQPKRGVLAIVVKDKSWSKCDLDSLGMNVLDTAGWDNPDLIQVVVSDKSGNLVIESLSNDENKNRKSAIPESCA